MPIGRREVVKAGVLVAAAGAPRGVTAASSPPPGRTRVSLDEDWRFALGHAQDPVHDFGFGRDQTLFAKAGVSDASPGPMRAGFDASAWRPVRLPHDWAVELPFAPPAVAPAQGVDDPRAAHGYKPLGREFPATSVGWYRRTFRLSGEDARRRVWLEFDGVFRDARVFVNGYHLVRNAGGYAPFQVDISDVANFGAENVLTVRVDASEGEGWFYEGAGIYRHVWLVTAAPVHTPWAGVAVRPELAADHASARLTVLTEVAVSQDAPATGEVLVSVYDPEGRHVAGPAASAFSGRGRSTTSVKRELTLPRPALWSVDTPQLHRLLTEVRVGGLTVDRIETAFGVRDARFDPERGFLLNGQPLKLKGTCNHQDHAGVGVALPDRLHAFRIERLKAMGSNAYRAAHGPPAPELLDACDRLGMLVIDETRRMSSDPESLDELSRLVRRDRNHPSVIAWSIGNEEPQQSTPRGARVAQTMKRLVEELDGTRPVTEALDKGWGDGVTPVLDVVGFNYRTTQIDAFHARFPRTPVMGTETASTVTTRGVYVRDPVRQFTTAYDAEAPWWATTAEGWWPYVDARPYIAGGFVWTGFDYRGEPTPFARWPSVASYFGVLDSCGVPKDEYFYYKAWWSPAPLLHLFPHWTWPGREGEAIDVWCHTNAEVVELFLDGRSLGARTVARDRHVSWRVPYRPGVLEARGRHAGQVVTRARQETAGPPARLLLTPDRARIAADGRDLAVVRIDVLDEGGRPAPHADTSLRFSVEGPGRLIGVGNGDPTSHEPDKASTRRAFNGSAMALVQSSGAPGPVVLRADCDFGAFQCRVEAA